MRKPFLVSCFVSFVVLGGALVGATVSKLKAHSDFSAGSVGHTVLTESTGTYCTGCHTNTAAVTGSFTDSAGNAITTAQLYPGEPGSFNIKASLSNTYTATGTYYMCADIAASTTA